MKKFTLRLAAFAVAVVCMVGVLGVNVQADAGADFAPFYFKCPCDRPCTEPRL